MNDDDEQKAHGVHQDVTLPAFHLFACVIPSLASDFSRFHALAIQAGGTRLRVTPFRHAQLRSQGIVDGLPQPNSSPSMIVVRNDAIGWEVMGQISPSATVSIEIEDGVEDFPPRIFDVATLPFGTWEKGLKTLPFHVTQVCRVSFSGCHIGSFTNSMSFSSAFLQVLRATSA